MLETPTLSLAERALDYASTRQDALADNVANIDTPGYQRKDASFADVLASAQADPNDPGAPLTGQQSDPQDIPIGPNTKGAIEVTTDNSGAMRQDGNNVDMDSEMAKEAQNQVYYQTLTEIVTRQFSDLKYVIEH